MNANKEPDVTGTQGKIKCVLSMWLWTEYYVVACLPYVKLRSSRRWPAYRLYTSSSRLSVLWTIFATCFTGASSAFISASWRHTAPLRLTRRLRAKSDSGRVLLTPASKIVQPELCVPLLCAVPLVNAGCDWLFKMSLRP